MATQPTGTNSTQQSSLAPAQVNGLGGQVQQSQQQQQGAPAGIAANGVSTLAPANADARVAQLLQGNGEEHLIEEISPAQQEISEQIGMQLMMGQSTELLLKLAQLLEGTPIEELHFTDEEARQLEQLIQFGGEAMGLVHPGAKEGKSPEKTEGKKA